MSKNDRNILDFPSKMSVSPSKVICERIYARVHEEIDWLNIRIGQYMPYCYLDKWFDWNYVDINISSSLFSHSVRNLVFATNSNFLLTLSSQPDGVNLLYFKLRLFDLIIVLNIKEPKFMIHEYSFLNIINFPLYINSLKTTPPPFPDIIKVFYCFLR